MKPNKSIMPERAQVETEKRGSMHIARKRRIAWRDGFKCKGGEIFNIDTRGRCRSIHGHRIDFDHEIPLAIGGKDDESNINPRCNGCGCRFDHVAKTALDAKLRAKAKRLAKPERKQARGRKWPSRPMQTKKGPPKRSKFKRKMNGEVVPR